MCDYSLHNVKSRPAKVGDKLTTQHFNTALEGSLRQKIATQQFASFREKEVSCQPRGLFAWKDRTINHTTAIFRQINKDHPHTHHDALEFPDGRTVLLTHLYEGQEAVVLQLPVQSRHSG
jgi:hypothetical protein